MTAKPPAGWKPRPDGVYVGRSGTKYRVGEGGLMTPCCSDAPYVEAARPDKVWDADGPLVPAPVLTALRFQWANQCERLAADAEDGEREDLLREAEDLRAQAEAIQP